MYRTNTVCFTYMAVNALHTGDNKDNYKNNDNWNLVKINQKIDEQGTPGKYVTELVRTATPRNAHIVQTAVMYL